MSLQPWNCPLEEREYFSWSSKEVECQKKKKEVGCLG